MLSTMTCRYLVPDHAITNITYICLYKFCRTDYAALQLSLQNTTKSIVEDVSTFLCKRLESQEGMKIIGTCATMTLLYVIWHILLEIMRYLCCILDNRVHLTPHWDVSVNEICLPGETHMGYRIKQARYMQNFDTKCLLFHYWSCWHLSEAEAQVTWSCVTSRGNKAGTRIKSWKMKWPYLTLPHWASLLPLVSEIGFKIVLILPLHFPGLRQPKWLLFNWAAMQT